MATIHQTPHPLFKPPSSFTSLPLNPPKYHLFPFIKPHNFTITCSQNTAQQTHTNNPNILQINSDVPKKKRKPKPSFYQQIQDKWSVIPASRTTKLPWQLQQQQPGSSKMVENGKDKENIVSLVQNSNLFAQVIDEISKFDEPSSSKMVENVQDKEEIVSLAESSSLFAQVIDERSEFDKPSLSKMVENVQDYEKIVSVVQSSNLSEKTISLNVKSVSNCAPRVKAKNNSLVDNLNDYIGNEVNDDNVVDNVEESIEIGNSWNDKVNSESDSRDSSLDRLPWSSERDDKEVDEARRKKSKTELAEKTIPEHELNRLRNVALRMKERIKVGDAGVTQAVVDEIHEKWKIDEVVKLKFEGAPAFSMKRSHEILESKTGGLVIWRSGSSVVLYRGLTYKLNCVNTYMKEKGISSDDLPPDFVRLPKNMSPKELEEMKEVDKLLDGLGPRFRDWSGRPPLPVDADLLPGLVAGYKTPFRLLPHRVLSRLKDSETTNLRRQSRLMPAHFALGRNRDLQGLAVAMVKLWEKSAVAKIAIKRGVLNTLNERMAEELKRLTGGTLLSRNKEYIVFYRGNDFMPPPVARSLKEREKLTMLQYEEEEVRRYGSTLVHSNSKRSEVPLVAGTLAETLAATSRWAKQPNSEDIDKMIKDSAVARRASLVRYLQHKQFIAKRKLLKAERALAKVQRYLKPEELPTDLETITDEERLVFRKMGLSMKPFLLLGRREVFDGTIENMHLHWKYRELVKIVVKGKSFPQVKHIAISLEAESGGVLVSIDKSTKGYEIIFFRGKNYRRPLRVRPQNLLTRRQALARSIELQRREGLKHHISSLQEQMELVKSELEDLEDGKEIDDKTFYEKLDDSAIPSDDEMEEDEDEEAYLLTYDSQDEK
ncbi:CRM-domain containing factor CFM3, chloroplastic/mitochondrial [Silene latifolia]|uniref:CRM-domain containing factor CFM3, chloroplastic/mitochondrial n=1 Tax=Silene latifolia TaxID=37657 RepID=UPI003D76C2DE